MTAVKKLFLIPGNHLYPLDMLTPYRSHTLVMVEDTTRCTRRKYHQQKIGLIIAAMREYAKTLNRQGFNLQYYGLDQGLSIEAILTRLTGQETHLTSFEISDHSLQSSIRTLCAEQGVRWTSAGDPGFLTPKEEFNRYRENRSTLRMADFYKQQRRKLEILVDASGKPAGGKWSFDEANRKKLPRRTAPPDAPQTRHSALTTTTLQEISQRFHDHPGDANALWVPTTREESIHWLRTFLEERLIGFGTYEDAISQRSQTLFHSCISPMLNLGLITPQEVVEQSLQYAKDRQIPLNDLEGFIRQLIGWREFVRGIYDQFAERLSQENTRQQKRLLTSHWHDGTTGLPPLDDAIRQTLARGWNHHIPRLMVLANLMNLCDIHPRQAYEFFMSHYIDAYDWVMLPNVYGMGVNSDSGVFASKPYICGSNYILKMSDYPKGDWCDIWDGLFWRYISNNKSLYQSNPRMRPMLANLARIPEARRTQIFKAAKAFISRCTLAADD